MTGVLKYSLYLKPHPLEKGNLQHLVDAKKSRFDNHSLQVRCLGCKTNLDISFNADEQAIHPDMPEVGPVFHIPKCSSKMCRDREKESSSKEKRNRFARKASYVKTSGSSCCISKYPKLHDNPMIFTCYGVKIVKYLQHGDWEIGRNYIAIGKSTRIKGADGNFVNVAFIPEVIELES